MTAFEIEGVKFSAKIPKERLVPSENDRLAIAYDEKNEVWNFKNLTSSKWLKNYAWRAHLMIFEEAMVEFFPNSVFGAIMMIPIVWLARHLSDFGYLVIMFVFIICLFLSLPLLCLDGKTRTDKANAYLALRKFLKEADL
ncbi:hypothetical protein [uncultured Campylobacter sp.]|uniref:hypothetical protein n=1 Tax=uncultured Campylobacter sp. TaxID=218934 RepID=UPI003211C5BA